MAKDVNLGKYIKAIKNDTYDTVLSNISKNEPPINPLEKFNNEPSAHTNSRFNMAGLFGEIFAPPTKTVEKLGRVVTKSDDKPSGFARVGGQARAIEQLEDLVIFPTIYPQNLK